MIDCFHELINFYLNECQVRCASPQLIETINKEIKEFVDKLRQDESQPNGAISLEFYCQRRGRWPFNETPLVWEIWTLKINCDSNESQQKVRVEDVLLEKLLTIVQIMNSSKCYLPEMPNQQNSDSIFDTNYSDAQPYIFKVFIVLKLYLFVSKYLIIIFNIIDIT